MKEFGSDYHALDVYSRGKSITNFYPNSVLYASGRQALYSIIQQNGWEKLWVPSYFCEETLNEIAKNIEIIRYYCDPFVSPEIALSKISPKSGDAIYIVNYFGKFSHRNFETKNCQIIEDHTHDLIGDWALNSTADWCVASLRKTLPIADGGIVWSPKNHPLPQKPSLDFDFENNLSNRWKAMSLKFKYLKGDSINKEQFLNIFHQTENNFEEISPKPISAKSRKVVNSLDIQDWYSKKNINWETLYNNLQPDLKKLVVNSDDLTNHFSMIFLFDNPSSRDRFRQCLIDNKVYPAILWKSNNDDFPISKKIGDTILSIHCDARYSSEDIRELANIMNKSFIC